MTSIVILVPNFYTAFDISSMSVNTQLLRKSIGLGIKGCLRTIRTWVFNSL